MTPAERKALRTAVADYMWSEGCSCCQDRDAHDAARAALAKLLGVRKKDDWHNFWPYRAANKPAGNP